MKIQNTFAMTAVILLPLIMGRSQEAGAPGQGVPIPAAVQPVAQPLSPEASFLNVTRFEVRDRGVVNLSITAEQVEKATGRTVRRLRIAELNSPGEPRGMLKGRAGINVYRPVVRETRVMTPIPRGAILPPAQAAATFEKLRRDEAAHRELEAQQARERATLEKLHDSELRTPPRGLSVPQLQQRHQAEHREFNEHVNRQNQVLEHRQQSSPSPAPQERIPSTTLSQRSGTSRRNDR